MTTKIYTRRDSATAVLRKLGVPTTDYARFIKRVGDEYHLDLKAAQDSRRPPEAKATKAKAKATKAESSSVAQRCRDLILEGLSNKDIFDRLQKEGALDEDKRHYPGWYRCQMRRQGHEV